MHHEFQNQTFSTRVALGIHIEDRVNQLPIGANLVGNDLAFALELLHRRPSAVDKVGPGVANVWLVSNGSGRGFKFRRTDNEVGDFSWRKATTSEPSTLSRVSSAMRYAVKDQTQAYRTEFFAGNPDPRCAITGAPLDPATAEVDHTTPFWQLRDQFIASQGGLSRVKYTTDTASFVAALLTDPLQIADWRSFHKEHAELRMTTADANRKRGGDVAA